MFFLLRTPRETTNTHDQVGGAHPTGEGSSSFLCFPNPPPKPLRLLGEGSKRSGWPSQFCRAGRTIQHLCREARHLHSLPSHPTHPGHTPAYLHRCGQRDSSESLKQKGSELRNTKPKRWGQVQLRTGVNWKSASFLTPALRMSNLPAHS